MDPGLTIGLASLSTISQGFRVHQTNSVQEALEWIEDIQEYPADHFLVEDYISGGHLTKEAKITIKRVGLFEEWGTYFYGGTQMVVPQARLSSVDTATKLIGDDAAKMYRNGKDAIAALAHAISFARENG